MLLQLVPGMAQRHMLGGGEKHFKDITGDPWTWAWTGKVHLCVDFFFPMNTVNVFSVPCDWTTFSSLAYFFYNNTVYNMYTKDVLIDCLCYW